MLLTIGKAGRTKSEIRRARKVLAADQAARKANRISIFAGLYLPTFYDKYGNEYWYNERGDVVYDYVGH